MRLSIFCIMACASTVSAADLSFKLLIQNGLVGPSTGTTDTECSLRGSMSNPVYLIVGNVPRTVPIGQAWYASLIDPMPPTGLEGPAEALFIDIGGFHLYAASVEMTTGRLATVSASEPASTLSGTWRLDDAASAGIAGGKADDAVVTFFVDFNAGPPSATAMLEMALIGIVPFFSLPPECAAPGPSGSSVQAYLRKEIDIRLIDEDKLGASVGKFTSYTFVLTSDRPFIIALHIFQFGRIPVLAVEGSSEEISISCAVSGGGILSRLSGDCYFVGGVYRVGEIMGITEDDQTWHPNLSLP